VDELMTWLRQQLDGDERDAQRYLTEVLGTRLERDACFRLADIEAKRRILDHIAWRLDPNKPDGGWESADAETDGMASTVLIALAQPYAGLAGWREERRL
jgi:hypothetical protein